jgi:hypothetical protein
MKKMKKIPLVKLVQWLGGNRLRLFFDVGERVETREATVVGASKGARVVDHGMGIDPGDGLDRSAYSLYLESRAVRKRPLDATTRAVLKAA